MIVHCVLCVVCSVLCREHRIQNIVDSESSVWCAVYGVFCGVCRYRWCVQCVVYVQREMYRCAMYVEQCIIHVQQVLYSMECIENGTQCSVHAVVWGVDYRV